MFRYSTIVVVAASLFLSSLDFILATTGLTNLENVTGKIVFVQREGDATYVRERELASEVPTETRFELYDPWNNLRTARFTYSWDLGNGKVLKGSEPSLHFNYSTSGNYTLRLKVVARVNKTSMPLTGLLTMDLTVLDAIKTIEWKSPLGFQIFRNNMLTVHMDGSPPITACWRFLYNCVTESSQSYHMTTLYENTLRLNHTFTAPGFHCLDISARNNISQLKTSCSIFVWRDPLNHLLFILTCTGILLSILTFICFVVCHPKKVKNNKPRSSVLSDATYSGMDMELQPQEDVPVDCHDLHMSSTDEGDVHTLLLQPGRFSPVSASNR
ncbi:hypothetical protein UPYG_G00134860 [Umbra pygmaea]|uniref:PKD domain-containing protein n=1 Tax=Umbra pygmaea TaxID=75934 RepID=A0ABD0WU73_UMBPY